MRIVDQLFKRWMDLMPDARRAAAEDSQYHVQMEWMKRMLRIADQAMADERVPAEVRERVIRTILFGAPDETAAVARIQAHRLAAEQIERDMFTKRSVLHLPGEQGGGPDPAKVAEADCLNGAGCNEHPWGHYRDEAKPDGY